MRDSARELLSAQEQERIRGRVEQAEKSTSGEIVPMVVATSSRYPAAGLLGALIVSLALALAVTAAASLRRPWGSFRMMDLWLFPAVFAVCFVPAHELISRVPALKRLFITPAEIQEEVEEAALTSFYREGLGNTRDRTGILIYVSMFERRAFVLADKGINDKVAPGSWQELVDLIAAGFGRGEHAEAICAAVTRCGEMLREHFPVRRDDTNELKNLIVGSELRPEP